MTEKYLWLGRTRLLAIFDNNNTVLQRFLYADGRMPLAMEQAGETYYFAYDQVGSLRAVTDASGHVIKNVLYDSFGRVISDSNPELKVPFGFAGGLQDSETGLVRFGYRDYDPETGRWTSKDPMGLMLRLAPTYKYAWGNPVRFIDSTGKFPFDVSGGGSVEASLMVGEEGASASGGVEFNIPSGVICISYTVCIRNRGYGWYMGAGVSVGGGISGTSSSGSSRQDAMTIGAEAAFGDGYGGSVTATKGGSSLGVGIKPSIGIGACVYGSDCEIKKKCISFADLVR
ncbi:RHS repeat domain-containing protein [Megalodesulfovibrio paquesii]